ncbi:MAG: glycerate kinase [Phycisphaerales bacterium]
MKVICAPDSFKGSLTAEQAARAIAQGISKGYPGAAVDLCPISDGGEGFTQVIALANRHTMMTARCRDPLGRPIDADWCLLHGDQGHDTAIIEMASASGLILLKQHELDATHTSTFGTGQLIKHALDAGAKNIILGIGGSATNDGGCGMAQALGVRFYDQDGQFIETPMAGGMLGGLSRIDLGAADPRIKDVQVTVACDVTNPLTGADGASHIYSPQKGATPDQVEQLDTGLRHLAKLLRDQLGKDVEHTPGAGAAGGLGGGLMAFCDATLKPGLDIVLEKVRFDERVRGCDLCLTGEGRLDGQSLSGKAVLGVAKAAAKHNVPTIALVGSLGPDHEKTLQSGLKDYIEIGRGLSAEESIARAGELLEKATAQAVSPRT